MAFLKKLVLLLIVAHLVVWIFAWLSPPHRWVQKKTPYKEYIPYVNEIRKEFGREMFQEFGLIPQGGSGQMHEKVEALGMEFVASRRATIEEARVLQLLVMDRFVQAINAHEKIQPFLEVVPFTYKRVTISISFEARGRPYSDGTVYYISSIDDLASAVDNRNHFFYYAQDPYTFNNIRLFKESYDEALRLATASKEVNPYTHRSTPLEQAIDQIFPVFVKEMSEKHGLHCWSIGGKLNQMVEEIGMKFSLAKRTTPQEARQLLQAVVEKLVSLIDQNEQLRSYLIEYPFNADRLKIRLCFVENNGFSYYDGSMESITLEKGVIHYFKILPDDDYVRPVCFATDNLSELHFAR